MESQYNVNFKLEESEQTEIVSLCQGLKVQLQNHAHAKKQNMLTAYSYFKGEFAGGDLLPDPSTSLGAQNDAKTNRPQIFIPISRTVAKMIYAQLKLSIFPNDDDFFRVVSNSQEGGKFEDTLTRGLAWLVREGDITEKMSTGLMNGIWSGNMVGYPCVREKTSTEWQYVGKSKEFEQVTKSEGYELDFEAWNPIQHYPDPFCSNPETSRWMYCCRKKTQEFLDKPDAYMNLDKLNNSANDRAAVVQETKKEFDTAIINDLQTNFNDIQPYCDYDLFYFPHLKVGERVFKNMIVGIADMRVLIRFSPNMTAKGRNPVVFANWLPDVDTPYGTGPMEDIRDIQKLVNIIWNYAIESAARNGNRWAVREDVDTSSLYGAAGGMLITADDPRTAVMPLSGSMTELDTLINAAGVLKQEAQGVAGSQNPFQGSSNIDFKKTATELQIIQENAMSVLREVIQHITQKYVQPCLELMLYQAADIITEPLTIRTDDKTKGTEYMPVDFSVVKQFPFKVEVTSVNMAQSKMAMVNTLKEFIQMAQGNPLVWEQLKDNGYHLLKLMSDAMGIKYFDDIMNTPQEQEQQKQMMMMQQMQQAQMAQQMGMMPPQPGG